MNFKDPFSSFVKLFLALFPGKCDPVCGNRGKCLANDSCLCEEGWEGYKCDKRSKEIIVICLGNNENLQLKCYVSDFFLVHTLLGKKF